MYFVILWLKFGWKIIYFVFAKEGKGEKFIKRNFIVLYNNIIRNTKLFSTDSMIIQKNILATYSFSILCIIIFA